jgi:hypothetical protein
MVDIEGSKRTQILAPHLLQLPPKICSHLGFDDYLLDLGWEKSYGAAKLLE